MQSASSFIKTWLLKQPIGPLGSAAEIQVQVQALAGNEASITEGAVSGFLYRGVNCGALVQLERSDGKKRPVLFALHDLEALEGMSIKEVAGDGSRPGRRFTRTGYTRGKMTRESLTAALLALAAEVEKNLYLDLSSIPTKELLRELTRRESGK